MTQFCIKLANLVVSKCSFYKVRVANKWRRVLWTIIIVLINYAKKIYHAGVPTQEIQALLLGYKDGLHEDYP